MGNVQQLQIAKKELSLPGSGLVVFPKKIKSTEISAKNSFD